LLVRTIPTSVAPPLEICKDAPREAGKDSSTRTLTGTRFTLTETQAPAKGAATY